MEMFPDASPSRRQVEVDSKFKFRIRRVSAIGTSAYSETVLFIGGTMPSPDWEITEANAGDSLMHQAATFSLNERLASAAVTVRAPQRCIKRPRTRGGLDHPA
jgi:hypothetical protein